MTWHLSRGLKARLHILTDEAHILEEESDLGGRVSFRVGFNNPQNLAEGRGFQIMFAALVFPQDVVLGLRRLADLIEQGIDRP